VWIKISTSEFVRKSVKASSTTKTYSDQLATDISDRVAPPYCFCGSLRSIRDMLPSSVKITFARFPRSTLKKLYTDFTYGVEARVSRTVGLYLLQL